MNDSPSGHWVLALMRTQAGLVRLKALGTLGHWAVWGEGGEGYNEVVIVCASV